MQPLVGWLLDRGWDGTVLNGARIYDVSTYQQALLILPITALIGSFAAWFGRETHCQPQIKDSL
jgi:hypothetical protein